MARLVAIDARGTPEFVELLQREWDAGNAVLPVDPRLPAPARDHLVASLRAGDDVEPGDALVVATSGTTGQPKGVVLTHAALAHAARAVAERIGGTAHGWLACLPLAHVGGLGVVTRALSLGQPLVVHDGFDADAAEAAARQSPVPLATSLVPTALRRLQRPEVFHRIILGGSAPPPPEELPPNVHTTYGLTETGGGVVYDGRPLPSVEVRISAGSEIEVRGPMLLRTYRDGTDPKDASGWLATGDAGALATDGRLVVHGRRGDLIITGGENVWPEPVERALAAHPGVAEVAVAGRSDPEWGQRVVAYVVPRDPAAPPNLESLRAAVKEVLPAYAAPREVVVTGSLPRTGIGKVARHLLGDRDRR